MRYEPLIQESYGIKNYKMNTRKIEAIMVVKEYDDDLNRESGVSLDPAKFNVVKSILELGKAECIDMEKDYIVGSFYKTKDALFGAQMLKSVLKVLKISVKVGVDNGSIYDEVISSHDEGRGNCVDGAIQLASVAKPDEIVISESLYSIR
ncbi:hypothetical protein [Candidatus Entotheonella palauensis]|uniref:hypothetical protein n=1 Tax=Candidatus Entotheonella palauensis TaxID=93172 RepID=UPI000B7FFD2B|nr:hypothetical protein [Candidatus Entotheonella palauensis]